MFHREHLHAKTLLRLLRRLARSADRKVFLILDNLHVHHTQEVELLNLPSCSPDLDPEALVSQRPDSRRKGELERSSLRAMRSIQEQPHCPCVPGGYGS
jgi:hypothetical protein